MRAGGRDRSPIQSTGPNVPPRAPNVPAPASAGELLLLLGYGDTSGGADLYPILDGNGALLLEAGERALMTFTADVTCHAFAAGAWSKSWGPLPTPAQITVTDRRCVYVCERFTKGSTWVGFGVVGLAVATTATVVSASRARRAREARAALGQVRWEWLSQVIGGKGKMQLTVAHPVTRLAITLHTASGGLGDR